MCVLAGCGGGPDRAQPQGRADGAAPPAAPVRDEPARPRLVALGDSLTAGLGLATDEAWPAVLERRLRAEGFDVDVVNAGVSGDTSAGGLRRLEWALEGDVRILIVALGGNDGLRGLSAEEMANNLAAIVGRARDRGIAVLLAGMEAPPNLGPDYTTRFRAAFRSLARDRDVVYLPFLLEGVAGVPHLNQADGIHPNAAGAEAMARLVRTALDPLLQDAFGP